MVGGYFYEKMWFILNGVKHSNLYYIFLEDAKKHKPPEEQKKEVLKIFKNFFKNIKPNEN